MRRLVAVLLTIALAAFQPPSAAAANDHEHWVTTWNTEMLAEHNRVRHESKLRESDAASDSARQRRWTDH